MQATVRRHRSLGILSLTTLLACLIVLGSFAGGRMTRAALQGDGSVAPALPLGTLPGNPSIQLVQVATGLVDPLNVTGVGDGSGRTFVVERVGRIRIVEADGTLQGHRI